MNKLLACGKIASRAPHRVSSLFGSFSISRSVHSIPFATLEVEEISGSQPAEVHNLGKVSAMYEHSSLDLIHFHNVASPSKWSPCNLALKLMLDRTKLYTKGKWTGSPSWNTIVDPLNGEPFIKVAEIDEKGIQPFVESLSKCPKHGLHNPFKDPERYLMYGDISAKAAHMLSLPKVSDFFTRLIQRVSPKSYQQAFGEVYVTQKFLENFSGDQVRFLARSFAVPGNHLGQQSHGFRWPYGPVALITPFNFPLEIPVLQLMGALYMGNKPLLKVDSKANPRMTLFTGSSRVADKLAADLKGRVKLEDAGFDWKILGPDVQEEDYVAWVCDQDAYACSGQKCSAQSILFMHENWAKTSLITKIQDLADRRKLEDLTVGPVLTVTTGAILEHINQLLQIPGSKLLFGGEPLENHSIPQIYGAIKPTAVYVPVEEIVKDNNYDLVTKEIFGPFQIITDYKKEQLPLVLDILEKMHAHLTAAVVSNDAHFLQARISFSHKAMHKFIFYLCSFILQYPSMQFLQDHIITEVIGKTVNGTTYAGLRGRTTGAPQNHWFGPAGDPRGAGIGTPEAIKLVWSCHREIIYDLGPLPKHWEIPPST
ncbi:hypothetical protein G4B88_002388 [Cannabis sativa]|uniref:Aldehyde dehydrogenase domain-containing protein n=1 Tax=Cannabis sativa TaxID=3483 RepID=A0A7J6I8N0_CANSA|nr:hypothetical protein G4B88_002388 [Cannabis sativa]